MKAIEATGSIKKTRKEGRKYQNLILKVKNEKGMPEYKREQTVEIATKFYEKLYDVDTDETSYLFKVARGLAFASSHLVEEEPCLSIKNVRKLTFVLFFFKKNDSLTYSHSLTRHLITHLIL